MTMFSKGLHYLKTAVIGRARNPLDRTVFHRLSLIAFFAWVGLGADGLSSSAYGPAEAFISLHHHPYLAVFVAFASVVTIFVISACYSQIIELFPSGGGGYLVASKLLSPTMGMISGCALIVDYILTITISIASGADAIFSFLPPHYLHFKLYVALAAVLLLMIMNLRGAKESVAILVPFFLLFIATHAFVIIYAFYGHLSGFQEIVAGVGRDVRSSGAELGMLGTAIVILRAYSMGAGTYTGIEAVSNGVSMLREPKVKTGKRTMLYMALSLAFMVLGLMFAYLFFHVVEQPGKTLNATLLENLTMGWPSNWGYAFVLVALASEAIILFVAAQAGFLDGPRILSNMAIDRWVPTKFALLSDRLITQNGILIMGIAAFITMLLTGGNVGLLVVLYSINVFITFTLSLLGMTRHWWIVRLKNHVGWLRKLVVSGTGLVMCVFILCSMIILKFHDGGWITLIATGLLVGCATLVKRHYFGVAKKLKRLDKIIPIAASSEFVPRLREEGVEPVYDPHTKTAVLFVSEFSGLGLYILSNIVELFGGVFKNFVFIHVGLIDSGVFKGVTEIERLQAKANKEVNQYVNLMHRYGYFAEGISAMAVDVVDEIVRISENISNKYPKSVFFSGKLVFDEETFFTRLLHNSLAFSVQRRLYTRGITLVILPVKVES